MVKEIDNIVNFDESVHAFNQPDTDFKAEVVASGLKEQGYDADVRTYLMQTIVQTLLSKKRR